MYASRRVRYLSYFTHGGRSIGIALHSGDSVASALLSLSLSLSLSFSFLSPGTSTFVQETRAIDSVSFCLDTSVPLIVPRVIGPKRHELESRRPFVWRGEENQRKGERNRNV